MIVCKECDSEVTLVKDADWEENQIVHTFAADSRLSKVLLDYKIPFRCETCGGLHFPYKATLDRVFVFPDPPPEKLGSVYIPLFAQEANQNEYGIVLSAGKGYVHKNKFVATEVKVGDRVVYDKTIMWKLPPVQGNDNKMYEVKYMGENDVHYVVGE